MKTPWDYARLRLSAVHPEMSKSERARAIDRIADGSSPAALAELYTDLQTRLARAEKEMTHLKLQLDILEQARVRARGRSI